MRRKTGGGGRGRADLGNVNGSAEEGGQCEARSEGGVACEAEGRLLGRHGWRRVGSGQISEDGALCVDDLSACWCLYCLISNF